MVEKVLVAAASSLLSQGVSKVLFGSEPGRQIQPQPTISEPSVAPVRDDEASRRAARRKQQQIRQRSGRRSTILSEVGANGTLG